MILNKEKTVQFIDKFWDAIVIPGLSEFISIPSKTPNFDSEWQKHGYLQKAVDFAASWIESMNIQGTKIHKAALSGRTPFLCVEIPGKLEGTVVFYGHLDKMPESDGWSEGLAPWTPVLKDGRLYGRGGVDDGYAIFVPIAAIKALQEQGVDHARCVILLECAEESGSVDFAAYVDHFANIIGQPNLVVCVDAGGDDDYRHLWCTTSLRGLVEGNLRVEVLEKPVHSGASSGVLPSPFRIARKLLSRIEDENTGECLLPEFHAKIPAERIAEIEEFVKTAGKNHASEFPLVGDTKLVSDDPVESLLNGLWRPGISVLGVEGLPSFKDASRVTIPYLELRVSVRIPPMLDADKLMAVLKSTLEAEPPYGAKVSFTPLVTVTSWCASKTSAELKDACISASKAYLGDIPMFKGEGGFIGIVPTLGEKFPTAQFMVSGVAMPECSAHGPNEFIDIAAAKAYNCCVAEILAAHSAGK